MFFGKIPRRKRKMTCLTAKIIAVAAIIGVVALIYLGAILPFAKAKLYTGSFGQVHLIKNVEDSSVFSTFLSILFSVGQEEAVRFLAEKFY